MTECACIWQQWDKEKGGKMYYIIRDGYSVINEKDNIAFYDIKTKRMINVFNIKGSTEYSVAELLNNPINTDLLDEVWSRYWKLITGNNSIMQFFVQVDEFAYLDEKKKYDCINEFINLNRDAYEMEKWAFFAAVKHVVWDSEIIYVGKTDLEKCFEELNWNSAETLDDSNLKENNLYVINLNEVDAEKIESFERIAVENSLARLYICEDFSHIWIGPALYGNQFGCLMCNDYAKDKMVTNRTPYLIPQVSQIYDDIAYKMRWQGELNDISNLLERTDDITENELKDCIDFISNNCSSASNTIIPFFKHRFSYNSIFKYYNLYLLKFEYYIMCGKLDSVKEIMEKYKNKSNTNKDILSAMTLLIEKIKGDSDNIKEYKMLLSNKLFKIDQLHSDDYCKCNICNCQKIKKAYDKFLIALPKGV